MVAAQAAAQDLESVRVAVLVLACATVIFWSKVVKLLITALAIALLTLLGMGVVVLLQSVHH
jgi:hypothetical protein